MRIIEWIIAAILTVILAPIIIRILTPPDKVTL